MPVEVDMTRSSEERALGAFIRGRMVELDINVTQLAKLVGVRRATIYSWIGPKPPSRVDSEILHRLAAALEVEPRILSDVWHEVATEATSVDEERERIIRSVVLSTTDLSVEELREALNVALAAAGLKRLQKPPGD